MESSLLVNGWLEVLLIASVNTQIHVHVYPMQITPECIIRPSLKKCHVYLLCEQVLFQFNEKYARMKKKHLNTYLPAIYELTILKKQTSLVFLTYLSIFYLLCTCFSTSTDITKHVVKENWQKLWKSILVMS